MMGAIAEKLGAVFMKPPRRRQRSMRSRLPSAAFACASTLMAHSRAASAAASGVMPAPILPLCRSASLPSLPSASWPDMTSIGPCRTAPT